MVANHIYNIYGSVDFVFTYVKVTSKKLTNLCKWFSVLDLDIYNLVVTFFITS